jgi:hypothetical protein
MRGHPLLLENVNHLAQAILQNRDVFRLVMVAGKNHCRDQPAARRQQTIFIDMHWSKRMASSIRQRVPAKQRIFPSLKKKLKGAP